uniref:Uncharacterized protein n=1 Tax=Arundo donax TaxID=35708 RepID=A0A0A8XRU9_ARUDO
MWSSEANPCEHDDPFPGFVVNRKILLFFPKELYIDLSA